MPKPELDAEIRQIEPGDTLSGLSFGSADLVALKIFLRKHARSYHDQNLAKTYGVFPADGPKKVIGYITLVCGQIETETHFGPDVTYTYDHCPAVKIARLAVDRRFEGRGLGKALVDFSLGVVKTQICPWVGCRFVVLDAKKTAVSFYEQKCGFTLLDTPANRERDAPIMFVDVHKL